MPGDGEEIRHKHALLVRYMDTRHFDAVVLTLRHNFAWYTAGRLNHVTTNTDTGVASLVITRSGAVCLTHSIEAPRVHEEELGAVGIAVRSWPWYETATAARLWKETLGDGRVACDHRLPFLPSAAESLDRHFDQLRWIMTAAEIARYRELARQVSAALETACKATRPDETEHALAGRIAGGLWQRGIRPTVILAAADDRIRRFRHPLPTAKRFNRYGMGVAGGEQDGLVVSCSRLFAFGPIGEDLMRRHKSVCTVDAAMISATRPGTTLGSVFSVAQEAYKQAGFPDEWVYHHQGGSTGYLGREVKATPGDPTPVLANQFFVWNPTIAGTKSEDAILVGEKRNEILSFTGDWPTTLYAAGDERWARCDILEI